ncbi:MAG TPA: hypothetical protein DEH25_16765 [Chloroflexi bacterium]|nr:hypothetical protein [Chloroflexota bacterium]
MSTESERTKILEMIESGVISAEDGIKLLDVLDDDLEVSALPELESSPEVAEPLTNFSEELPNDFDESPEEVLEPDEVYHPEPMPTSPDLGDIKKWKRWWVIPMWIGVGITVIGGALMYGAFARSGIGFWFACAWFPFMLGVLVMALAWASRTAPWLHVRVQQKPGETPQRIAISFPLPVGLAGWGLRTFGHYIPNMEGVDLEGVMKALKESAKDGTPFFVDVDDEDGEHVQVFIG